MIIARLLNDANVRTMVIDLHHLVLSIQRSPVSSSRAQNAETSQERSLGGQSRLSLSLFLGAQTDRLLRSFQGSSGHIDIMPLLLIHPLALPLPSLEMTAESLGLLLLTASTSSLTFIFNYLA